MTFYEDKKDVLFDPLVKDDICFVCSKKLENGEPIVEYSGFGGAEKGNAKSLILHIHCGNVLAQRLLIDSWKNRRKTDKNPFKA